MSTSILFVCLGNICRSPTAEQVFRHMVAARGMSEKFRIDSAGTGDWHVNSPPDERAQKTALERGYDLSKLRARMIIRQDFENFDLIITMDSTNIKRLQSINSNQVEKIKLLLSYIENSAITDVPDPYFGEVDDFENTLTLIEQGCTQLLNSIVKTRL